MMKWIRWHRWNCDEIDSFRTTEVKNKLYTSHRKDSPAAIDTYAASFRSNDSGGIFFFIAEKVISFKLEKNTLQVDVFKRSSLILTTCKTP